MEARLVRFGIVEIDGVRYDHDVVVDEGRVIKRKKGPSKPLRERYGHTPLTAHEAIPWGGSLLVIGTGADGALPIDPSLRLEAERRGVELVVVPTRDACALLAEADPRTTYAILHVTC
jgi:hypothetical protein